MTPRNVLEAAAVRYAKSLRVVSFDHAQPRRKDKLVKEIKDPITASGGVWNSWVFGPSLENNFAPKGRGMKPSEEINDGLQGLSEYHCFLELQDRFWG